MSILPRTTPASIAPVRRINFATKAGRELRRRIYTRDGFTCRHCGWTPPMSTEVRADYAGGKTPTSWEPFRYLQIDHVIPLCRGGAVRDERNLQTLCNSCNGRKSGRVS